MLDLVIYYPYGNGVGGDDFNLRVTTYATTRPRILNRFDG